MRAGADRQPGADRGIVAERAIDALAGLRGEDEFCTGRRIDLPSHLVAAGQSARGVDQHGLQAGVVGMRQPDFCAALLEQRIDPGLVIMGLRRESANAAGALVTGQGEGGGHCAERLVRAAPHPCSLPTGGRETTEKLASLRPGTPAGLPPPCGEGLRVGGPFAL